MLSIGLVRRSADAVRYYEKDDYYTREQGAVEHDPQEALDLDDRTSEQARASASGESGDHSAPGDAGSGGNGSGGSEQIAAKGDAERSDISLEESDAREPREAESQGVWGGKAAASLGLEGSVKRDDFQQILDGRLPNGIALGRTLDGEWQHTPGWDLTFSAPKSVSVLAEIAQDSRLHEAHDNAVTEALEWTQENAVGARVPTSVGTVFERTGSMIVAQFTHHTSRNQDPNLHTHAVVANATQTTDGQWRSVHSRELFNNKMAIGQIYRSALAREILALGYTIEQTHRDGRFEIVDVPKDLVRALSSRREQVESKLAQWGAEGPEAAAKAALVTRARKEDTPLSHLIERWRALVAARDIDLVAVVEASKERGPKELHGTLSHEMAMREAIAVKSEKEAVFRHGELVREFLQRTLGRADVATAERLVEQARVGVPLRTADEGGVRQWTTTRASVQEQRTLEIAVGVDREARPYLSPQAASAILADKGLTAGQALAAEMILSTDAPHMGVLGRPGTGKTTLMNVVRAQLARQGVQVIGLAQNSNAARNLEKETGISSSTIHKHLRNTAAAVVRASSTGWLDRTMHELTRREELWVVDESSQIPNNLMSRLLNAADRLGARVVFVGDTRQLGAIEAGKPFGLLLDRGLPHVEMDEIKRQYHEKDRAIVVDAIAGRVHSAMDQLRDKTVAIKDADDRLKFIVDQWARDPDKRDSTIVFTLLNKERTALNEKMRNVLRAEGKIGEEKGRTVLEKIAGTRADTRDASFYNVGNVVHVAAALSAQDIERGAYLEVLGVDPKANTLEVRDLATGQIHRWDPRKEAPKEKFPPVVYERRETTLADGERVRWLKNDSGRGLINGEVLIAERVKETSTIFRKEDGTKVEVPAAHTDGQHWTHAYSSTVYAAQGQTAENAIVHLNSEAGRLLDQTAFVVAVSRHRDNLTVVTNSEEKLRRTLERNVGEKTSAVEALERHGTVDAAIQLERELTRQREADRKIREAVDRARPEKAVAPAAVREKAHTKPEERTRDISKEPSRARDQVPRKPPVLER
jgi:conjugative relaxase-like TrwC/TraI family protein